MGGLGDRAELIEQADPLPPTTMAIHWWLKPQCKKQIIEGQYDLSVLPYILTIVKICLRLSLCFVDRRDALHRSCRSYHLYVYLMHKQHTIKYVLHCYTLLFTPNYTLEYICLKCIDTGDSIPLLGINMRNNIGYNR